MSDSDSAGSAPATSSPFDAFGLDPRLLSAIAAMGFSEPTPIQSEAIPVLLSGRDVVGRARTGSGKTAAYGLPLLERVKTGGRKVRALVLAPTRELAVQVAEALSACAADLPVRLATIYGGVPYAPQFAALREASVVVGTPGRVIDHMDRGSLDLSGVEVAVLDEADEMLRMGFVEDVERILGAMPSTRQTALFSATMPERIQAIARSHLTRPVEVQVEDSSVVVDHIRQRWIRVPDRFKLEALLRILAAESHEGTLVFARTRVACAEIAEALLEEGVTADALHGDMSQQARERVLNRLRARQLAVVVATDVAARGLDVAHLTHVVNFDLPEDLEGYVHRIGRTGRAGNAGLATSFVRPNEARRVAFLERLVGVQIERVDVPSDAGIARRRQQMLLDDVNDARAEAPAAEALVRRLVEEGRSLEDLAIGAIAALARERRVRLDTPEEGLPEWARARESFRVMREAPPMVRGPAPGDDRPRRDDRPPHRERDEEPGPGESALFLPVGSARGVRPGDIVAALHRDAGVPDGAVGRIAIFLNKTFVALPEEVLRYVLANHRVVGIRGMKVPLDRIKSMEKRRP
jgi:ATP-dependent RNA helicase DeaD